MQDPSTPPDQDPEPKTCNLYLSSRGLRIERRWRYYDIDGGPRGSMSWQSGMLTRSFTPESGWRQLLGSDLDNARPSAAINRPPSLAVAGLKGHSLFLYWFRASDAEFTLCDPNEWKITDDPGLKSSLRSTVTVVQKTKAGQIVLLDLDPARDFLPVVSRVGTDPGERQQLLNYRRCGVKFSESSDAAYPYQLSTWTSQEVRNGRPQPKVEICTLVGFTVSKHDPSTSEDIDCEFPSGIIVADESKRFSPSQREMNPQPFSRTESAGHPVPYGYWGAMGFAMMLSLIVLKRIRGTH
ncbi:MAG: hypothetical protein JNL58_31685 [Planctomyces sp.]|nr:hypothetical protein [Planctomyces sp.]